MPTFIATLWIGLFSQLILTATFAAELPVWETQIERALERSKNENKDLLLTFRGPSLNPTCKRINEEVFDGAEFRTVIGHQFILFHVLDPKDQLLDEAGKAAYRALLKRFHIKTYPIILLSDPEGRVYAQTAIQKPDAKSYVQEIAKIGNQKAKMEQALKLSSPAGGAAPDAKLLSAALDDLGFQFAIQHHLGLVDQVIELDQDDAQGLKSLWAMRKYQIHTLQVFNQIYVSIGLQLSTKKTAAEKVALFDETINKHAMQGELRQLMEMRKFSAWSDERNYQKMLEVAQYARELAPETATGKRLPDFIRYVEKLIANSKADAVEPNPEKKPAAEKPAEENPAAEKPAAEKPAAEKPAAEKPAQEKPAEAKPAAEKPAG